MESELGDERNRRHARLFGIHPDGVEVGLEPLGGTGYAVGGEGRDQAKLDLRPRQCGLNRDHRSDGGGVIERGGDVRIAEERTRDP